MAKTKTKDPQDTLDYDFNWNLWLADGETISSFTITVDTGITKSGETHLAGLIKVWISGGTAKNTYKILCSIVTSLGNIKEWTGYIRVANQ